MTITVPACSNVRVQIPVNPKNQIHETTDDVEQLGVSVKKAAKMIDLSERTVWTLIKEGQVRSVRCGTRVIVSVQSLREFVDGKNLMERNDLQ